MKITTQEPNIQLNMIKNKKKGTLTQKPNKILNKTHKHWQNYFTKQTPDKKHPTYIPAYHQAFPVNVPKMKDTPITAEEVEEYINSRNDTAPGPDKIKYSLLKKLNKESIKIITEEINTAYLIGSVPPNWKHTYQWSIYKRGKRTKLENYRPIMLSSVLLKILTGILKKRINNHLEKHKLLSNTQSGFRKNRSTQTQILALKTLIQHAKHNKNPLYLVYIDLRGAFDSVPHEEIIRSLHKYGVSEQTIQVLENIYNKDNKTQVITEQGLTKPFTPTRGTKQGDPISPLIFNLFIDPILHYMQEKCTGYKIHKVKTTNLGFADDLVFTADTKEGICKAWDLFCTFCYHTGLEINTIKSVFTSNKDEAIPKELTFISPITNKATLIKRITSGQAYNYLGTWITAAGEEDKEIKNKIKKTNKATQNILKKGASPALKTFAINSIPHHTILNGNH